MTAEPREFVPDSSVVERVTPSPNFDERKGLARPDMIVLHYTGMEFAHDALYRLCDPKARVSSHYFVHENGSIHQLVPEAQRAWHAGISFWQGETDINARSIGIEIANRGHDFGYPNFPRRQIAAVITLCRGILTRHPMRPDHVVAHSDVAPSRKQDPGEKFPWRLFAESGVGLWVPPVAITAEPPIAEGERGEAVADLQQALIDYGFGLTKTGEYDAPTKDVVTAFQRHWRPAKIDGLADKSTIETLRKLIVARDRALQPSIRSAAS